MQDNSEKVAFDYQLLFQLNQAFDKKNGNKAAALMNEICKYSPSVYQKLNIQVPKTFNQATKEFFDVLFIWLKKDTRDRDISVDEVQQTNYEADVQEQNNPIVKRKKKNFPTLLKIVQQISKKQSWFIPMSSFFHSLFRRITINKSKHYAQKGDFDNKEKIVEESICDLRKNGNTFIIKSDTMMIRGLLNNINEQLYLHFHLQQYYQCRSLFNQFIDEKLYLKSENILYNYYHGRMCLLDYNAKNKEINPVIKQQLEDQFGLQANVKKMRLAQQRLLHCLELLKGYPGSNKLAIKKQVLKYLIPLQMNYGIMPSDNILEIQYQFPEYACFKQCILSGNLNQFELCMRLYQRLLIKRGLFVFFEKLKLITVYNLFRKVFKWHKRQNPSGNSRIDTAIFHQAINFERPVNQAIDVYQVELFLNEMHSLHYIKGNIFHSKGYVMFKNNYEFLNISNANKIQ